jgi:hypothetical protein
VALDGTSAITLQAVGVSNTFIPGGNMCGRNESNGAWYATYQGVVYTNTGDPGFGGTAGITSTSYVSVSTVYQKAALAGCTIY